MRIVLKIVSIALLIIFIGGVGWFLIYPSYSDIVLKAKQLNINRITNNAAMKMFADLQEPVLSQATDQQDTEQNTIEQYAQQQLQEHLSQGGHQYTVEDKQTELVIPTLNIKGFLTDGDTAEALDRGFWFYPTSAPPGEPGNTIIIGHRFQYLPPDTRTFFNLDKLKIGDKIIIRQMNKSFTYTVVQTKVVNRNDFSILQRTHDFRLTLITCTPLWTSKQRLVIISKLDRKYQSI